MLIFIILCVIKHISKKSILWITDPINQVSKRKLQQKKQQTEVLDQQTVIFFIKIKFQLGLISFWLNKYLFWLLCLFKQTKIFTVIPCTETILQKCNQMNSDGPIIFQTLYTYIFSIFYIVITYLVCVYVFHLSKVKVFSQQCSEANTFNPFFTFLFSPY